MCKYRCAGSLVLGRGALVMRPPVALLAAGRLVEPYVAGVVGQLRPAAAHVVHVLALVAVHPAAVHQLLALLRVPLGPGAPRPGRHQQPFRLPRPFHGPFERVLEQPVPFLLRVRAVPDRYQRLRAQQPQLLAVRRLVSGHVEHAAQPFQLLHVVVLLQRVVLQNDISCFNATRLRTECSTHQCPSFSPPPDEILRRHELLVVCLHYLDEIEQVLVVLLEMQVQEVRSVEHGHHDVLHDAVVAVHHGYQRQAFVAAGHQHTLAEYGSLECHSRQQVSRLGLHLQQGLRNESEFTKQ